ncbi:hypothetical protein ABTE52_21170, partial [Acinetobacter baumannii]
QRHDAEPVAELPAPVTEAQPEEAAAAAPLLTLIEPSAVAPEPPASDPEEGLKLIGPLRISIALFNIFLNEADELSRRLSIELAEWA